MRSRDVVARACVLGLVGLGAGPAWGYVREVTKTGVPIAWRNPCIELHLYSGSAPTTTNVDLLAATAQAAAAWSYPQVAGTDIRLSVIAEPEFSAGVGKDDRNVIVFRTTSWCRAPSPVDDAGVPAAECYPSSVLAVTTLFKNTSTGEILDTDIELNGVNYAWGDLVATPGLAGSNTADFQNAVTHELGHVVGLDHNCYNASEGKPRLVDNTGTPELDCSDGAALPELVTQATMFPSVVIADTTRRTLSADDEQGVSEIYPHVHEVCPSPSPSPSPAQGGCNLAPPTPGTGGWPQLATLACAALFAILATSRRRLALTGTSPPCRRRTRTGKAALKAALGLALALPVRAVVIARLALDVRHGVRVVFGHPAIHVVEERRVAPHALGLQNEDHGSASANL